MSYTIDGFWQPRLAGIVRPASAPGLPGWTTNLVPNPSFVEAELGLREDHRQLEVPVWFVAAPGAVGKSTLAREISARTGAVYLNLAEAETVAGNYLTGGLARNRLLSSWQEGHTAVLIDALDEARLRVTQSSFEDFLSDVEQLARGRAIPTVFFGRVGLIEEAWLVLAEKGLNCPIFDIRFFDLPRAEQFVMAALGRIAREDRYSHLARALEAHRAVYESASAAFVRGLSEATASDGARFAGYAPVLEAVAVVLAGEGNPAALSNGVRKTMQGRVIEQLVNQILEREAKKLQDQLATIPSAVKLRLYTPEEQLNRLTGLVLGHSEIATPVGLTPQQLAEYETAVKGFMVQHPFVDGTGRRPSGAVFAAVIYVHGLFSRSPRTIAEAERRAGSGPHTPNPFLVDFYLGRATRTQNNEVEVPAAHVVILYESIQARTAANEVTRMTIEGDEETDDADVEIQINNPAAPGGLRRVPLHTSQASGPLRFGRQVNGTSVDAPRLDVVIGSGNPVEIITPVAISVRRIMFDCPELFVRPADQATDSEDTAAFLEASEAVESRLTNAPAVRRGAELLVSWPGATAYPWTHFSGGARASEDANVEPVLLGLRRLVIAFRSHGKGRLARFRGKIEHARITKGPRGVAIRERLMQDHVLTREGDMYFLDSSMLGRVVGATYQDLKLKRFNPSVRRYAATIG